MPPNGDEGEDAAAAAAFRAARPPVSASSREPSPAPERQKRPFSPASDDGDLVVPAARNEDAETPTPEDAPLIRQAVGFSWAPSVSADVAAHQAPVAPQSVVDPCFLPGQAPPRKKPKTSKPRAPRKKKDEQYSNQTTKFKLGDSNSHSPPSSGSASLALASAGNSASICPSVWTHSPDPLRSMTPAGNHAHRYNRNATRGPNNTVGATPSVTPPLGAKRSRKSPKGRVSALVNNSPDRPGDRPSAAFRSPIIRNPMGPFAEPPGQAPNLQRTYSATSCVSSSGTPGARLCAASPQGWSTRMVTVLIEDVRSGVPDPQLAEVRVPLKLADGPEDGFWGDALDICNALQGGPSRIDGPAKVYTMRGKFRQFFMRVDQLDQLEVQSAHLAVTNDRTLRIFVEAPVPQGQLPRPLPPVSDVYNSGSERETVSPPSTMYRRRAYSFATREDQLERLSKSNYARAERRMVSPASESGSYGHSQRTESPNARHRQSGHYQYNVDRRPLTPPIPGRLADTQEEKDEAIANYIRSHIENHPGWVEYMQSKGGPQRVYEVLKQYMFVEDRVRELIGRKTPAHWDGAPSCYVEKYHVWRVLKLNSRWGEDCQETLVLVAFYGKNGSRYEDSAVIDMIDDASLPKANTMDKFLRLLRAVDESFTRDTFTGRLAPMLVQN